MPPVVDTVIPALLLVIFLPKLIRWLAIVPAVFLALPPVFVARACWYASWR